MVGLTIWKKRPKIDAFTPLTEPMFFCLHVTIARGGGAALASAATLTNRKSWLKGQLLDAEVVLRSMISMPTRSRRRLFTFLDQNDFGNRRPSGNERVRPVGCDPVPLTG